MQNDNGRWRRLSNSVKRTKKTRIAALIITLGQIEEPVSSDGCESHANGFTEIELTNIPPSFEKER